MKPFALNLCLIISLSACWEKTPDGPPLGYEQDERGCSDGRDNDRDGLLDCDDPDCLAAGFCGELVTEGRRPTPENTLEACNDSIDNDEDGQFDCGDRDCQGLRETCCSLEFSDLACSDGRDNDGNGFVDCEEFTCRGGFVTVCEDGGTDGEEDCSDRDNADEDGDDLSNCFDPDCFQDVNCPEAEIVDGGIRWLCADGIDNDGDGTTDCQDPSCAKAPECKADEDTLARCMDGVDNDGNTFVDCNDFSCSRSMNQQILDYCASLNEDTPDTCGDGIDNDGDGFTDCVDRDCQSLGDDVCPSEDTLEECRDGVDNDEDGFLDCADFSCTPNCCIGGTPDCDQRDACNAEEAAVLTYCTEQGENTYAKCQDGIDNDGNGFADCNDRACNAGSSGLTPEPIEFTLADGSKTIKLAYPCQETVTSAADCADGIDNDQDGFTDCEDWECSWNPLLNPGALPIDDIRRGDWPNNYNPDLHPCVDPTSFTPLVCGGR